MRHLTRVDDILPSRSNSHEKSTDITHASGGGDLCQERNRSFGLANDVGPSRTWWIPADGSNDRLVSDGATPSQSEGSRWKETTGQLIVVDLLDGLLSRSARGELPVSLTVGERLSNSKLSTFYQNPS